jgi:hypothetical protein
MPGTVPEQINVLNRIPVHLGNNECSVVTDLSGRKLLFKRNSGGRYRALVTDTECRRRDINNIVASRILQDVFGLDYVIYRDASLTFRDGLRLHGVVCDYIENLRFFHEALSSPISNPEQAINQVVALAWLGDLDRIENPGNECIDQAQRYIALDFDFCFGDGITILGIPNASRRALERFATAGNLNTAIGRILALDNSYLANAVARIGRTWVSGWSAELERGMTATLIRNRDRLRDTDVFGVFSADVPTYKKVWARIVTRLIFKINIPKKLYRLVATQGILPTIRELFRKIASSR